VQPWLEVVGNACGTIALTTTIIGNIPQVYKSYRTKSTGDISMVMLINYLVCSISWLAYGIIEKTEYVIWSNLVATVIAVICIIQKLHYDEIKRG
jgi:MtN3 and saliva related transmembrane protein